MRLTRLLKGVLDRQIVPERRTAAVSAPRGRCSGPRRPGRRPLGAYPPGHLAPSFSSPQRRPLRNWRRAGKGGAGRSSPSPALGEAGVRAGGREGCAIVNVARWPCRGCPRDYGHINPAIAPMRPPTSRASTTTRAFRRKALQMLLRLASSTKSMDACGGMRKVNVVLPPAFETARSPNLIMSIPTSTSKSSSSASEAVICKATMPFGRCTSTRKTGLGSTPKTPRTIRVPIGVSPRRLTTP